MPSPSRPTPAQSRKQYMKAYCKKYYANPANREKIKERRKTWYRDNREYALQRERRRYQGNKERHLARCRRWAEQNAERVAEYQRIYQCGRRATLRQNSGGSIRKIKLADILAKTNGKCGICREPITSDYEIDHIIPVSKGGRHELSNLQAAHRPCNRRKHNSLPDKQ